MNELSIRFIEVYNYLLLNNIISGNKDFALKIGVSASMVTEITKGRSNVGVTALQNIVSRFDIDGDWLLTGKGEMLKTIGSKDVNQSIVALAKNNQGIPLYDVSASAGNGSFDEIIKHEKVIGRYIVPDFKNIDWMIYVRGSSMYPKYSSGDIVACRILHESKFIQWGKVYVVATREQGLLVKRLEQSNKDGHLLALSDNTNYKPFDIPYSEISGIALVVGVIRLE
jgi:phage repressor protein C with HTH and peptisase S24 domain